MIVDKELAQNIRSFREFVYCHKSRDRLKKDYERIYFKVTDYMMYEDYIFEWGDSFYLDQTTEKGITSIALKIKQAKNYTTREMMQCNRPDYKLGLSRMMGEVANEDIESLLNQNIWHPECRDITKPGCHFALVDRLWNCALFVLTFKRENKE